MSRQEVKHFNIAANHLGIYSACKFIMLNFIALACKQDKTLLKLETKKSPTHVQKDERCLWILFCFSQHFFAYQNEFILAASFRDPSVKRVITR
jgi:hypothetical protein